MDAFAILCITLASLCYAGSVAIAYKTQFFYVFKDLKEPTSPSSLLSVSLVWPASLLLLILVAWPLYSIFLLGRRYRG